MNIEVTKIIEQAKKRGWTIIFGEPSTSDYLLGVWNPNGDLKYYNRVNNKDPIPKEVIDILVKDRIMKDNMNNNDKINLDGSYIPRSSPLPPPHPSPHHKLDKNVPSSDESKNNSMINYKLIAERLWGILDDIDTAFDHYKPDMKDGFVNYVNEKSKERSSYANSLDGQTLTFNEDIPTIEDLDPMCRWFKDAWCIEKELKSKPEVSVPKISETEDLKPITPNDVISEEPTKEEENIEVKLHNTTDAQVWTDDFFKTFGKVYPDIFYYINSLLPKEGCESFKEWVFGWFCNAIQTGIDLTNNERDKEYIYILKSHSGEIVEIFHFEPSEYIMDSAYRRYLEIDTQPNSSINCTLYRYSHYTGIQYWNGKAEPDTKYNWKNV